MSEERRVHALIQGRVQGVYFRKSTQEAAQKLGLAGWVRNLPDGQVECEAQGSEEEIAAFVGFLHQGPRHARVEGVRVREVEGVRPLPHPFEVRR